MASGGVWQAARPIAAVGPWRFVVQSAVPGERFRQVLSDLTPDDARPEQLRQIGRHLEAVGGAIHSMQQAPLGSGPRLDVAAPLAAQRRNPDHHTVH